MTDEMSTLEGLETASATADNSLNAATEPAPNIVPNEAKPVTNPWNYSADIPGVGEKPDWFLNDKYSDVSRQAEAYVDANKKLGEFAGAPKDGYNLEKYKDIINTENPFLNRILESSKNLNMTQGGLEEMLDHFVEYEKSNTPDHDGFIKSLNPHETEMAKNVFNWAQNNFTEDEIEIVSDWLSDKNALNILSKMRGMSRENRIPANNVSNTPPAPGVADVQAMIKNNYSKYKEDPAYRARLRRQLDLAIQREGQQ